MAVFRLRLNNPLIVQGVINRLYVIQFTRYRHAFCFAGSFWIISHSNPFVKNFFRSFPNFFDWIFFPRCSREQLGHFSTDDFICQELFYIFFQIPSSFSLTPTLSRTACVYYHMLSHLSRDFYRILELIFPILWTKSFIPKFLVLQTSSYQSSA